MEFCGSGKVRMVMGGPPCRSVLRLRQTQPGPPPLRLSEGVGRFGIVGQTAGLQDATDVLTRMLFSFIGAEVPD